MGVDRVLVEGTWSSEKAVTPWLVAAPGHRCGRSGTGHCKTWPAIPHDDQRGCKRSGRRATTSWFGGSTPVSNDEIADFGTDLGRVTVPLFLPVAVNFPARACQGVRIVPAPLEDGLVRLFESTVRAVMRRD